MSIDNTICVEVPEGIDLQAELAGTTARALAYSIDASIRLIVTLILSIVMVWLGDVGAGFFLICLFVLEWFYPVLYEVLADGQTPGKKRFNIRVVNADLTPIRWEASIIRNLLRAVDFLPFANLIGLISMLSNREFKRLGDYAAGTLVIHNNNSSKHSLPEVEVKPLPLPLSLNEQLAIINFCYRHKQLSHARQQELAQLLHELHHCDGEASVKSVQGLGLGLLGKR